MNFQKKNYRLRLLQVPLIFFQRKYIDDTWYIMSTVYLNSRYEAQAASPPATMHSDIGSNNIVCGHIAARSLVHLNITNCN